MPITGIGRGLTPVEEATGNCKQGGGAQAVEAELLELFELRHLPQPTPSFATHAQGGEDRGGGVVCVFAFILLQHGWGGGLRQRASVLVRVILIGVLVRVVANDTP